MCACGHRRLEQVESTIGFDAKITPTPAANADHQLGSEAPQVRDLISYGFLPEFVGRFPVVARLSALSTDEMMHVMTTPRNALLKQYCALCK